MLARQLGITVPPGMPEVPSRVADWCAHTFTHDRKRWLIFCNTASLYPIFAHAKGVDDGESLIRRVGGMVPLVLRENGHPDLAKSFESELHEVQWAPIPGRSVLGSMNELVWLAEAWIGDPHLTPAILSRELGRTPMSALGMNHPAQALATLRA
ncbi:MAG: hypothetical protein QG602_1384 [Verrucomicrobiota bacterium]|nr:hypothetical protein [Verrucomicrobiota bacterium]